MLSGFGKPLTQIITQPLEMFCYNICGLLYTNEKVEVDFCKLVYGWWGAFEVKLTTAF